LTDIFLQGTTLVVGGSYQVDDFYSLIPGSEYDDDGFYHFPCDADLPDISFYLSGKPFSFTQSFNFGPVDPDDPSLNKCIGGVRAREDMQWWILGTTFMTNYYNIFDIGQPGGSGPEVGFATLA
jgi:hypothetical protein